MLRHFILLLACLALPACGGSPPIGTSPDVAVLSQAELPAPQREDLFGNKRPYLIGPFDKLSVSVFGVPDLTSEVQTDAGGQLSIPLAGTIRAAGQTPTEVAGEIASRLRGRYVRDPQVTVNLVETVSQVLTVEGEVERPGSYPVLTDTTLLRAVANAQGTTEFAKTSEVIVFRTVGGQRYAGVYDLRGIRRGNYADPAVFANDVIVVSESRSRRLLRDVIQASPLFLAPVITLLR